MKIALKLTLTLLLFLLSCKKSSENKIQDGIVAEWKSTEKPVPYSAILKINNNHTFLYSSDACDSHSSSKGKWEIEHDTIILNSYEPEKCCFLIIFGGNCEEYGNEGKEKPFQKSFKDCDLKTNDFYDVFKNSKFCLKNKKLVFIKSKNNNCKELAQWNNDFIFLTKNNNTKQNDKIKTYN